MPAKSTVMLRSEQQRNCSQPTSHACMHTHAYMYAGATTFIIIIFYFFSKYLFDLGKRQRLPLVYVVLLVVKELLSPYHTNFVACNDTTPESLRAGIIATMNEKTQHFTKKHASLVPRAVRHH